MESVKQISRISQISKLQVDSASSIFSPAECLRVYIKDTAKPVTLFLEGESNNWLVILNELLGGKLISTNSRDSFLMQQATQNTLLLDALIASAKLDPPRCLHSKNVERALDILSYYSKEETKQKLLISCDATKDILLYKINPNADELDNASVECLIYVPGTNSTRKSTFSSGSFNSRQSNNGNLAPTVWCGMSNGKIRIFDASSWRLYPRYVQAADRVVCLTYDGTRVWAGSFDHKLYVIENDPQTLEFQLLDQHCDAVVDVQVDPQSTESLFSADIIGTIVQWNTEKLEVIKQIKCPYDILKSFKVVSHDEIWCCCKDNLIKIDLDEKVKSTLYYIDERDRRLQLDCFSIVGDDIWAGCTHIGISPHSPPQGRLVVWDKKTESRRAILPLDARGVGQMIAVDNFLYVGCKCPYMSRRSLAGNGLLDEGDANTKSKLYIINASEFEIMEELSAHNDSIRSMYAVSNHYVLTGSTCKEGKIAIWKHHVEQADTTL